MGKVYQRNPGVRAPVLLLIGFLAGFGALSAALASSNQGSPRLVSPQAILPGERLAPLRVEAASTRTHEARRIVSLIPAATEILFAIGAGERLVGRTRWGIHPAAARTVPDVGDGIRPALELIVARNPDLVILVSGADNAGVGDRLRTLQIPTLELKHNTLEDLDRNIIALGEATGCGGSARLVRDRAREDIARLAVKTRRLPRPTVYYDVWEEPPITIGGGSYLDALIEIAGGRNVFGDLTDPSPQVSLEAIVARAPEVLLFPVARTERRERRSPGDRHGWSAVRAVADGRVHQTDGDLAHRLGPRVAEAALEIARALHPEAEELRDLDFETAAVGVCRP
jgi:ABC-type Fe3+-hydroxamate transport system substrate-binding protein